MIEKTYTVTGMTCDCCARSVTEGIGALTGVTDVSVDLPTGGVTVAGDGEVGVDEVRAAVEAAGYQLTT